MRIRSIRLQNVRRFVEPVQIAGIGDGLNVLTAPNERGKSTFLDALHAVFFKASKAWDKEIRALVPHAGGDPSVTVEIETPEGLFRIEKNWNKSRSGTARVYSGSTLLKQADNANDWIADVLKPPRDGGPAGLLWVRQGQSNLGDGNDEHRARRDLLSSVAGEVEAVTGGRRMDLAKDICRSELEKHLTRTGRIKSDGPLKKAMDEVGSLRKKRDELQDNSNQLREAFNRRRELRRSLRELEDPGQINERRQRLERAESEFRQASLHNEKLEQARQKERAISAEHRQASDKHDNLEGTEKRAQGMAQAARTALTKAEKVRTEAKRNADAAAKSLQTVLQHEAATSAADLRKSLETQLKTAELRRHEAESRASKAKAEIADKVLAPIEALDSKIRVLKQTRKLESAFVRMHYNPGCSGAVTWEDGTGLADQVTVPIPDGATLILGGLGRLAIDPGKEDSREKLEGLESELAAMLANAGFASPASATESARRRVEAENGERDARAALEAVAPNGIEVLRDQLARLPQPMEMIEDLPSLMTAREQEARAREALDDAEEEFTGCQQRYDELQQNSVIASERTSSAASRWRRAGQSLAAFEDPERERRRLEAVAASLKTQSEEAHHTSRSLAESAPDLDVVKARLERARSAVKRADEERSQNRNELSSLNARIDIRAGEAVEEELAAAISLLLAAEQQLSALQFEVDVLKRLGSELESASSNARDQYVRPVLKELQPLVRILWPEAELNLDAENVLPESLSRAGTSEEFDVLSGGTKEQIALLVRLAFARLLARGDSPAPVILDDAIVFSDDDRIERVFDALTTQAQDLQIIVFSCRQRAFRELGGQSLTIVPA